MLKFNRLLPLFLALFLPVLTLAQGVVVSPQTALKTVNGVTSVIPAATITVCAVNTAGLPCSPALVGATFKDAALSVPLANPFSADANGNYNFAIANGTYTVTVTASGFTGYTYQLSVTCPPAGPCTFSTINATGAVSVQSLASSGQITSTLVTGTAPLSINSATPVATLTLSNHPQAFNCGAVVNNGTCTPGSVLTAAKVIMGSTSLVAGSSTVSGLTFANGAYQCTLTDATAANATKIAYNSGSQITVTGTATDVIVFVCIGN